MACNFIAKKPTLIVIISGEFVAVPSVEIKSRLPEI
jgi:hypothetical protein